MRALSVASATLSELGVRHALVGGLAVGAWGYPRNTRDIDFLVGEEAFVHRACHCGSKSRSIGFDNEWIAGGPRGRSRGRA
jgi:hypothetical protein